MGRFLFVVPPLVGHINPTLGLGDELIARGHTVAWAGHRELIASLDFSGSEKQIYDCDLPESSMSRDARLMGPAALKFLWESVLIPLADSMAADVETAITHFNPDIIISDQQALAGYLIGEKYHLPVVTSATTSAELLDPLSSMPKVKDWLEKQILELRLRIGNAHSSVDPRFSPTGLLAFTTEKLTGPLQIPHLKTWFVGPMISRKSHTHNFPWEWINNDTDTVLVSLGTANDEAGQRFLNTAAEAIVDIDSSTQAIIVDPANHLAQSPWANHNRILLQKSVPQIELLPLVSSVVSHGGHNTVCETLWNGIPLIVAPIRDDQPVIASQVVEAGVGIRVKFGRTQATTLTAALKDILLPNNCYRKAATEVGKSFREAGGAQAAAMHLEKLCKSL
ncbi:MAG: glycosyltransferase [Mycobacteriaceae bacterium]